MPAPAAHARRFLRLTPETAWGTYNSAGTAVIIDLDGDNTYTVHPKPQRTVIRTAASNNRRRVVASSKSELSGNLNLILHGSQGTALASWLTPAAADTATYPPSMTIDYCVMMEDSLSTLVYARDLGMSVQQAQIRCSDQDPVLRIALQLYGSQRTSITATDFPEPLVTDYPTDPIYVLSHLASGFTLGSTRAQFDDFNLTIKNTLDSRFFGQTYVQRIRYCGRDVDFGINFPYLVTTDRGNYEGNTPAAAAATFTNGAHSLAFQMNSKVYYDAVEDDFALDKIHMQNCSLQAFYDPGAATPGDFSITAT